MTTRRAGWDVQALVSDAGQALRRLLRSPAYLAVAVMTLALTIGANTAILSIADAVLLRPLPYGNADHLQVISMWRPETGERFAMIEAATLRLVETSFRQGEVARMDAAAPVVAASEGGPEAVAVAEVSENYFDVLGVRAHRGRLFRRGDATGPGHPVVLSYGSWLNRFGGDPSVVGGTVRLGDETYDVLGVLPRDFLFPSPYAGKTELVTALASAGAEGGGSLFPVVRLADGVSREQARAAFDALVRSRLSERSAGTLPGRPLVAVQVATAVVLVFGAAVAGRALVELVTVPLGFDPDHVALVRTRAPDRAAGMQGQAFFERVAGALASRSDVVTVGATGTVPLVGSAPWAGLRDPATGEEVADIAHALPGYFEAAGIPLLRGRTLDWSDAEAYAPVAVLGASAAARLFPGRNPVGATFQDERGRAVTVVGIVSDPLLDVDTKSPPLAFVIPGSQTRHLTLLVRTRATGTDVLRDIRRQVADFAPGQVVSASWWSDEISALTAFRNPRFQTLVLGGFGLLALGLTALGIYGVVAYLVASRTREMGIRLALGCTPAAMVRTVVGHSLAPVLVGLTVGLVATRGLARLAQAQLFRVETADPAVQAGAVAVVVGTALVAAYLPARRASRVDPVVAQRAE